jgi:hypothetical protein
MTKIDIFSKKQSSPVGVKVNCSGKITSGEKLLQLFLAL